MQIPSTFNFLAPCPQAPRPPRQICVSRLQFYVCHPAPAWRRLCCSPPTVCSKTGTPYSISTPIRRGPDALSGKAVLRCNWRMAASEVAPAGGPPGLGAAEALGAGGGGRGGVLLSAAEREFVTKSVEQGVRPDGRERLASRSIHLETGVIPGAFGSAQAQCGGTKVGPLSGGSRAGMRTASCACLRAHAVPIHVQVVAAVKAELVSPAPPPAAPGGRIEVSVTCSLTASPLFEGARGEAVSVILFALLPHAFGCCA